MQQVGANRVVHDHALPLEQQFAEPSKDPPPSPRPQLLLVGLDGEPDVEDEASDRAHDGMEEGDGHRIHREVGDGVEEDAAYQALAPSRLRFAEVRRWRDSP